MAEVQKTVQSGELAQAFIQFVMLQAQNILFVLGKIPTPEGMTMPPNLHAAKMLIDQLEMIKHKTQGNLSKQEEKILDEALSSVQLAFVEVSGTPASMMPKTSFNMPSFEEEEESSQPEPPPVKPSHAPSDSPKPQPSEESPASDDDKKKFFKNYG
ncbi:MAG: DUF1844 domain-containing protein [Verrucomicrobiota bacterium]